MFKAIAGGFAKATKAVKGAAKRVFQKRKAERLKAKEGNEGALYFGASTCRPTPLPFLQLASVLFFFVMSAPAERQTTAFVWLDWWWWLLLCCCCCCCWCCPGASLKGVGLTSHPFSQLVWFLRTFAIEQPGIFRVPGEQSVIDEIARA